MALINTADLRKYAEAGYNVLFEGKHGVGKTEIIKATFEAMGYKWLYFSASTLDPWVDLIGVPKAKETKRGEELTLVRPSFILDDNIDAIFFDELNRAPDKVLNAVMELIQFKSINGHKLKNLKVIWAAVNPWDDANTYAVNDMDPALKDRFQVQIPVPYKVDEDWFTAKFPDTGRVFCTWWRALEDDIKDMVSPRRLATAADAYNRGLKLTDILTQKSNIKALRDALSSIPFFKKIEGLKTDAQVKAFLSHVNNVTDLLDLVREQNPTAVAFLNKHKAHVSKEIVAAVVPTQAEANRKLNHVLTEQAIEALMKGTLDDRTVIFDIEAPQHFKVDTLFQLERMANPKFNFLQVIIEELKLYKTASKAAADRTRKLTGHAVEYLSKVPHATLDKHDLGVIGLIAGLVIEDRGEQFTLKRAAFLNNRLKNGGANCKALADLFTKADASAVIGAAEEDAEA